MKNLYLIGGGGHCHSCIDVIEQEGKYKIQGIFDTSENVGKDVLGYKIIGTDADIKNFAISENFFLITVGQIKTPNIRMNIADTLKSNNAQLATVISPRAYVSKHATVKEGTIVMHDCLLNAGAKIGQHCIVNNKALVEHDSFVSDFCHISTASVVNGDCKIEMGSFVGSNAVLREGALVKENSVIPAGSFFREK